MTGEVGDAGLVRAPSTADSGGAAVSARRSGESDGPDLDGDGGEPADAGLVDDVDPDVAADPDGGRAESTTAVQRVIRRILRRPIRWWNRPWSNERVAQVLFTSSVLVVSTVVMMSVVHFNPLSSSRDLLLDDTTPTGGDMGAHVWAPAFLRDNFLPNFQLNGWSMDWYGGLPLYRFYMVVPALAIVALDALPFLSYGQAFKLVAASGLVLFPFVCWAFGRLAAFRRPIPELFAFAGLCFLLDESFEIYGGNVKSTMAGEYSFSIALTLAVLGLGLLANGLRTGRFRVWTAVVLSLAAVSHGIVLIFVAVMAVVMCLVWIDRKRLVFAVTTGVTTLLLSAWWVGPFLFGHEFMTDMKYGFRPSGSSDSFWDMYFPLTTSLDILVTALAVIGFVAVLLRRQLTGITIGLTALLFVWLIWNSRDSLPVIGLLWNPRLLPFFYLLRYMLMVIGAYELLSLLVNAIRGRVAGRPLGTYEGIGAAGAITISCLLVFGWMYETLPFDGRRTDGDTSVYAWGPLRKGPDSGRAVADAWTRYNWRGYEGRVHYPEYYDVVTTMEEIGDTNGCGRALWENNEDNSDYGTTMSLMLLPHWTDGCISSMEGLFFEASGTTPYHFLTAAAMSESSSNPVRQLRYVNNDAEVGVQHMEDLGVRYLMVRTEAAKAEAETRDELTYITTSGPWDIYELEGASIVEPLTRQPVIVEERGGDQRERNLELGTSWFQNRDDWPVLPADTGPDDWQRVEAQIDMEARDGEPGERSRKVDYLVPGEEIELVDLPPVEVSDVEVEQQSISFEVDEVGVPVLVRVSYFPNWEVSGAEGPYRVSPNFMVVVPTSNQVELTYGRSALDWLFYGLTAVGIGLCFLWRRQGDLVYPSERPRTRAADADPVEPPAPVTVPEWTSEWAQPGDQPHPPPTGAGPPGDPISPPTTTDPPGAPGDDPRPPPPTSGPIDDAPVPEEQWAEHPPPDADGTGPPSTTS